MRFKLNNNYYKTFYLDEEVENYFKEINFHAFWDFNNLRKYISANVFFVQKTYPNVIKALELKSLWTNNSIIKKPL